MGVDFGIVTLMATDIPLQLITEKQKSKYENIKRLFRIIHT